MATSVTLGQHVVVRGVSGQLRKAVVEAVPREWRDRLHGMHWTTRGDFDKAWVRIEGHSGSVPWPLSEIFTTEAELAEARRAN